ncbi:MAG: winged helix-turn-helix domain-containing protein [Pseudomonadota bacterium]
MTLWTIGEYRFDANANRLSGQAGDVLLEPKASALLAYFCQHPGRDIGRDELLQTVWHGQVVSDNTISRVIVLLRKALRDDDKARRYIATVPKVGYRLIAEVQTVERSSSRAAAAGSGVESRHVRWALVAGLLAVTGAALWWDSAPPAPQVRSIVPLSRLAATQSNAAVATDGLALLYTANDGVHDRIYYVAQDGIAPVPISAAHGDADFGAWADDGSFIVYQFLDGDRCEFHRLERARLSRGSPEVVYECIPGSYSELSLSPDSTTLYFLERATPTAPYAAFALDLERRRKRRLSQPVANGYGNHYLDVHPHSGTLLLLSDHLPGKTSVFELDPTRDAFALLRTFDYGLDSAIWSHREGYIVHPSQHPSYQLMETPLDGRDGQILVSDSRRIASPRRLPTPNEEGHEYLFTSYLYNRDIHSALDHPVDINSAVMDYLPAISHAGERLAFVSKRAGYSQIWIQDFAAGSLRAVEPPDRGRRFLDLRWSPDDRQLLANTNTGVLIYEVDADPELRHDVSFSLPAYGVSWHDRQTLSLSHYESGRWKAYQYRLGTGETVALDDRWAFSIANEHQRILLDQSFTAYRDGQPLPSLQDCANPVWRYQLRWQLDGEHLYCHARDADSDLLRFNPRMTPTRLPDAVARFEFFSVRRGRLATTRVASSHSDIMRTQSPAQ